MTHEQIRTALRPMLAAFSAKMTPEGLDAYVHALSDLHPLDLDEAIAAVTRTHGFHSAPTPSAIREAADTARRARITAEVTGTPQAAILPADGEGVLQSHTIPGIGTIRLRVLPDDHPALQRYACPDCRDTGWLETSPVHFSGRAYDQVTRCQCHPAKGGTNPVIVRKLAEMTLTARKGTRDE